MSGVLTTNVVEKLKVRKKAKSDFNLGVDISRTATARAPKFCIIFWLELSNIYPKSGVLVYHISHIYHLCQYIWDRYHIYHISIKNVPDMYHISLDMIL